MSLKRLLPAGSVCAAWLLWALVSLSAHTRQPQPPEGWYKNTPTRTALASLRLPADAGARHPAHSIKGTITPGLSAIRDFIEGRRLVERETFGGNGRTCATCHSEETGTVSPQDAQLRFRKNPRDPLFRHDGSDDEDGDGLGDGRRATRMLADATILVRIPLHPNVTLKRDPTARFATVERGIPATLNTPALDPVIMLDGRELTLEDRALAAITDHAQGTRPVQRKQLEQIATFHMLAPRFFTSFALEIFSLGGPAPGLPLGRTASERRGRKFFEDRPPDLSVTPPDYKVGACAACHSGPLMNQTNQFLPLPLLPGGRFQTVLVSEFAALRNPASAMTFVFRNQLNDVLDGNPDGTIEVISPDPGRALVTGQADDIATGTFDHTNAFKISPLRGIRRTAPYFHDNSARTLDDVVEHYRQFFLVVSDPPGDQGPVIVLTEQDKQDLVAFMKLLD
jgi:cytochrome c peroxidase